MISPKIGSTSKPTIVSSLRTSDLSIAYLSEYIFLILTTLIGLIVPFVNYVLFVPNDVIDNEATVAFIVEFIENEEKPEEKIEELKNKYTPLICPHDDFLGNEKRQFHG